MISHRKISRGLLAGAVAVAMAGCGTAGPDVGASTSLASSGANFGASDAQVGTDANIMELNSSGDLNNLSDDDLMSLDNSADAAAGPVSKTDPTVEDLALPAASGQGSVSHANASGKTDTNVGIVRSNTDGRFFLQVSKGFLWWKTETSIPLTATDSNIGLRIASDLNCKVITRGVDQGGSILVRLMFKVPDFSVVWGLFTRGHIAGKAYDSVTMVGVPDASITIHSLSTGRIWRAISNKDGAYSVGQLDPGEYAVDANAADYGAPAESKIAVSKMHTSTVDLPLVPQMNQPSLSQQPVAKNQVP